MLRLNASPDAARTPGCSPRTRARALALPLGVALSGLLAAATAGAQPAPQRQPPAGSPVAPGPARQQPGAAAAPPAASPPAAPTPAAATQQPGSAPAAPPGAAAPQPAPPAASAPPYPAVPYPAPPQEAPQAPPGASPGYPPPGPPGGYAPYGGAYPHGGAYPPLPPGYPVSPSEIPPAPPPVPLRRKSPGLMLGGIALTAGGTIAFFTGTGLLASASNRYEIYCDFGGFTGICETRTDGRRQLAGALVSVAGGLMIAVGIPLWVIGGKKVPAGDAAPKASVETTLSLGPGSAALQTQF
ncbi:hypothetical protein [Sorangium sp. So ce693]|uniref:hypothetical protein n=1 Tax=Sorangium sp. So ce693 TaxID=3133318 RepID=UPI003F633202